MLAKKNTYIDSAYQHFQVNNQDKQKRMEQRGEARINKLNTLLIQDKRFNDLERSVNDISFQKQLMSEYGI